MIESDMQKIAELNGQGLHDVQISKILCYSSKHIGEVRRSMGIPPIYRGNKRVVTPSMIAEMHRLHDRGYSYAAIGTELGISRYTVYDYLGRRKHERKV